MYIYIGLVFCNNKLSKSQDKKFNVVNYGSIFSVTQEVPTMRMLG